MTLGIAPAQRDRSERGAAPPPGIANVRVRCAPPGARTTRLHRRCSRQALLYMAPKAANKRLHEQRQVSATSKVLVRTITSPAPGTVRPNTGLEESG
jgi:hypothetical protein